MKFYHATTMENALQIAEDGVIRAHFGEVFFCKAPLDACKFLILRGLRRVGVFEVELDERDVEESFDHNEHFFGCKAYIHHGDVLLSGNEDLRQYDFDL